MADPAAVPLDGNRGLGDRDAESVPNSWRKSRRTSEPSSSKRGPSTSLDSNGASLRMSRNTARSEAGGSGFRNKPQRFRIVLRPSSFTGEKLNGSLTGPFATIHPTAHPTEWFAVAQWPQISAGESWSDRPSSLSLTRSELCPSGNMRSPKAYLSSQDNGHSRSDDRLLAWKIAMQAAIEQGAALTVGARVTVLRVGQREPILLHQGLLR